MRNPQYNGPRDNEDTCHCGTPYDGWDHCPVCMCEQYESYSCIFCEGDATAFAAYPQEAYATDQGVYDYEADEYIPAPRERAQADMVNEGAIPSGFVHVVTADCITPKVFTHWDEACDYVADNFDDDAIERYNVEWHTAAIR